MTNNDVDIIFDNFIEQMNCIPLSEYRTDVPQYYEGDFSTNRNIINNIYYIRRLIEINIQRREFHDRRERLRDATNNILNNFIDLFSENLEDMIGEDVKITLSNEEFNKLDSGATLDEVKFKECPICLDDITSCVNKLIILKCKHVYHRNCIKEWLCNQSTKCCICRYDTRYL